MLLRLAKYAAFFAGFLLVLYCRRSAQIQHPQVWDEDGCNLLPDALANGASSLLHPVNGYLVLVPKLICLISLRISFLYFPTIGTVLAWLFIASVCFAITFCPTWLRGRALLGFATLLIPSDAECFGIPLYTFWWASLLLFLVVLWQNESRDIFLRTTFLILGGLSAPIIALIPPLLALRVLLLDHKRRNSFFLIVSLVCTFIQYLAIRQSPGTLSNLPGPQVFLEIVPRFFGNYVLGNLRGNREALWIAGSIAVCFTLAGMRWDRKRPLLVFLLFLCVGAMLMSAVRVDLRAITPSRNGQRYFFFPFILIAWTLINVAAAHRQAFFKLGAGVLLLLALANVFPVLSRKHVNLHWCDQVISATHFDQYSIPIEFDGFYDPWQITLPGSQVRALLAADYLVTNSRIRNARTFPYSLIQCDPRHPDQVPTDDSYATTSDLASATLPFTNPAALHLAGFTIFGSYFHGDEDCLSVSIHLHRGDKVVYCSGPQPARQYLRIRNAPVHFSIDLPRAPRWAILDFSSDQLPREFTATFSDQGDKWGEWFAIALKNSGT